MSSLLLREKWLWRNSWNRWFFFNFIWLWWGLLHRLSKLSHLYPQWSSKITPPPLLSFVRVEYRACIFPKPTFSLCCWQVAHFLSTCELSILVFLLSSWLQVRDVWQSYELELVNYQNKCRIIRGWDDLFTKVKEHINSVSAMKLSPYYKVWCTCVWLEYNLLLMQLKGCEMLLNFFSFFFILSRRTSKFPVHT